MTDREQHLYLSDTNRSIKKVKFKQVSAKSKSDILGSDTT